nr:hypothetical protein [uncultured Allomuricauda sp.]
MKISSQLRSNRWKILTILVTSLSLIGLVLVLGIAQGVPIGNLTSDIVTIANLPIYTGFFSQIGIFFWVATATLCIFSAGIGSKTQKYPDLKKYLYVSGLLTALLCLDDIFLLHEVVFPFLGIPEKVVFLGYGSIVIFWIVRFYSVIMVTDYILLVLAFVFFGLSVTLDVFTIPDINPYLFEDGFKMAGIISWFFYFYDNAITAVSGKIKHRLK